MAFARHMASQAWSSVGEVPTSIPLIWAGRTVKTGELHSLKKAFTYQKCELKREFWRGMTFFFCEDVQ